MQPSALWAGVNVQNAAPICSTLCDDTLALQALVEALRSGHIGGAGLDAHHEEPADPSEPLYQHPNVIATPHTGVSTLDVVEMYSEVLRDNIVRRREGRELLHRLL